MNRIDIRRIALALIASALLVGTSPLFEAVAQERSTTATVPQIEVRIQRGREARLNSIDLAQTHRTPIVALE